MTQKSLNILLQQSLVDMQKSAYTVQVSYEKCQKISLSGEFDLDDLESYEALTARFGRTSDILTQKVIKTYLRTLGEQPRFFADVAKYMEKLEIVDSSSTVMKMRELRNQISHEYADSQLHEIFQETLLFAPVLLELTKKTIALMKD